MTEKLAEEIITVIRKYRSEGITAEEALISRLEADYAGSGIDFELFLELMNTGVFRAGFMMAEGSYPRANLTDNIVLQTALRMYWIEHRGEEDYLKRFCPEIVTEVRPKKKWWPFR